MGATAAPYLSSHSTVALRAVAAACLTLTVIVLGGCKRPAAVSPTPVPTHRYATATVYPLAAVVRQVAGEPAEAAWDVTWFCEGGLDPRDLHLTDEQKRLYRRSDLIVTSGYRDEGAADMLGPEQRLSRTVAPDVTATGRRAGADHGDLWLDPQVVIELTDAIREHLTTTDPPDETYYRQRAEGFVREVTALDDEFLKRLTPYRGRNVLSLRMTYGPLLRHYGLIEIAPLDTTPQALTDDDVRRLKEAAKANATDLLAIDAALLQGVRRELQARTGLRLLPLDALGTSAPDGRSTYLKLMRYNLEQLEGALK